MSCDRYIKGGYKEINDIAYVIFWRVRHKTDNIAIIFAYKTKKNCKWQQDGIECYG